MRRRILLTLVAAVVAAAGLLAPSPAQGTIESRALEQPQAQSSTTVVGNTIQLAGTWGFRLDADDVGVAEKWYGQTLADSVRLPGTTDENHQGILKDERRVDRLSRVWYWKGPAWYQKQVTIPESWSGKHVTLLFERTKHTRVWIDESFCGWDDTLSAAQVFDVSKVMTPDVRSAT